MFSGWMRLERGNTPNDLAEIVPDTMNVTLNGPVRA
jgi:hypothetical protein